MNTPDRVRNYLAKRPGVDARTASKNLNVTLAEVKAAMEQLPGAVSAPRMPSKSVKLLRVEFDDVGKVQKAMKEMSRSEYVEDADLRRSLHIAEPRWREVKAHPSLSEFQMLLPNKKTVWMHESAQQELRAAIDLSQQ